ncbi:hypothetical protein OG264_00840 [Streptomyces xanthophaeus]|uniref:hypothetical protein n=1 Tax=Streptomyces xanthophaeus TaxID=67385 RepID=UPI0038685E42|nr:hypothetical protein OG264_00840 [Streptomyces xanthophaeus]WST64855.1 hypothetical protein OG605_37520 [Streptomyces xanthophaeus]
MPAFPALRDASPATGAARALRAAVLAVLCVLLPMAGQVLTQEHTPRWVSIAALALIAVTAALVLTKRKLTDTQLLVAFAAAELTYHLAYSLPGACAAMRPEGGAFGLPWLSEQGAATGPPSAVLVGGHLITLLLAARLLGVTEQVLWRSTPLVEAVHRVLSFVWPLLGAPVAGTGPQTSFTESSAPLASVFLVRGQAGRAPPRRRRSVSVPSRLTPATGSCMA